MEGLIKNFINGAISAYMRNVTQQNVSASITKMNLDISELDIFPNALLQHGCPLEIRKGTIKNIKIKVPPKFRTQPIIVSIDEVTILCRVCTRPPTPEDIIKMKVHLLDAYELFRSRYKLLLSMIPKPTFISLMMRIFGNIIFDIKNIHLHIEYPSDSTKPPNLDIINDSESDKTTECTEEISTPPISKISDESNDDQSVSRTSLKPANSSKIFLSDNETELSEDSTTNSPSDAEEESDASSEGPYYNNQSSINNDFESEIHVNANEDTNIASCTAIGVIIPRLLLHNPKGHKVSYTSITKEVVFTELGIYMDVNQPPVDTFDPDLYRKQMHNIHYSRKHRWILEPFTFSAIMKREHRDTQIQFEPWIEKVFVHIQEEYIDVIMNMVKGITTFMNRFSVAHIVKPSVDDAKEFWGYIHKCAVAKISNAQFDFSKKIDLLRQRLIYMKHFKKNNPESKNIIKQMDESLDYGTIIAFRSCYRITNSKKSAKRKLQITRKDTERTQSLMAQDPVYIVTKFLRMLALNFSGKTVTIALEKDTGQKHFVIDVKNPHFIIGKDSKAVYIKAVVSYLCVRHVKKIERIVFKSLDNDVLEMKANLRIPFLPYSNWSINLDVASNNYLVNLDGVLRMSTDLGLINLFRSNKLPSKQTRHLELNMNVLASSLIFNTSPTRAIKIAFDKFSFVTQSTNLDQEIKLENSWISLISTREVKINSDFSLSGIIIGNQISLLIPAFSIVLPLDQFIIAEDIIKIIMKYQGLFRDSSFPKLDIKFGLDMRGIKLTVKIPDTNERPQIQFQNLLITFSKDSFHFTLGQIDFQKYFALQTLSLTMTEKSLTMTVDKISLAIFQLIALLPKDLIAITTGATPSDSTSPRRDNISTSKSLSGQLAQGLLPFQAYTEEESDDEDEADNLHIPDIQIGIFLKEFELNLSVTHERFGLTVTNIKASLDKNILSFGALLNQLAFQNQTIAQNISLTAKIILNKIFDIAVNIHNCELAISKPFVDYLFSISPSNQFALPDGLGFTLQFNIDEVSISNEFFMNDFNLSLSLKDGLFDINCGMESIDSTYLKLKSKDLINMTFNLSQMHLNLNVNLDQATIYIMPLIGLLNKFPTIPPSALGINLMIVITPLKCAFVFGEDVLTVKIDHQLKFRMNTLEKFPKAALLLRNFKVALNKQKILDMNSLKFSLDKNTMIQIPEINITFSILKIYKLIKIISSLPLDAMKTSSNPLANLDISKIPYESLVVNIPSITLTIHQSRSLKSVNLSLDKTVLQANKVGNSIQMNASTNVQFGASDGFQSNYVTPSFLFNVTGEYSETVKKLNLSSEDKILFALDKMIVDEMIKSLTSTEDQFDQPYSLSNETGQDIELIFNYKRVKIGSQEILPNVQSLLKSKFKIKINNEELPILIDKVSSHVSIPLFVGQHFILVVMDQKRLQLRFMSSFSIKNKSQVELDVIIGNQKISLQQNDRYDLAFELSIPKSLLIQCCGAEQNINLNEPQVINFNNRYIYISRKRNERTLHTKVTFSTTYSIQQTLLNPIELALPAYIGNTIVLEPCQVNPFPYFPPSSDVISFYIKDNEDFKGFQVDFMPANNKMVIETVDNNGNPFVVHISLHQSSHNQVILITPLIIVYNFHLVPFLYSTSNKAPIKGQNLNLKESIPTLFPVLKGKGQWKYEKPIMVSPQHKENENISIYFSTIYSKIWTTNSISLANLDNIKDFEIPIGTDKVSLTHVHIFNHTRTRPNTFMFFISPKFVLYNQTARTFHLNLVDNILIELPPNSSVPITMIRDTCEFSIGINPKLMKKPSGPLSPKMSPIKSPIKQPTTPQSINQIHFTRKLNLKTLYSQFVKVHSIDSPILLQLSKEKELNYITISLNRALPFKFVNKTKTEKITFIQKDTADFAHTVMPNSSIPFFIFDENKPPILHCEITTKCQFDIDVNIPTFPSHISDIIQPVPVSDPLSPQSNKLGKSTRDFSQLYYSVSPSMIEGSTITLGSFDDDQFSDDEETAMTEDETVDPIISLNFNYVSLLLINQKYKELFRFTIQGISVDSIFRQNFVKTVFSLNSIKLDDQNPFAVYPVVFHIQHQNNQPAVKFEIHSYGNQKIGLIKLETQPIFVKVDLSFISDLIGCFSHIGFSNNIQSNVTKSSAPKNPEKAIQELYKIELSISEILENLMPKDVKFRINKVIVAPIQLHVSFEAVTSRSKHPLQTNFTFHKMIYLIPSFNNVLIATNQHEFDNLAGNGSEIIYRIIIDLKTEILKELSLKNIIVRSGRLVMNLAKVLYDSDARKSTKNVIGTHTRNILSATSASLNYISLVLNYYTQTPQEIHHDTTSMGSLFWGVKQFGRSVGNGMKSLIVEPIKYGNINGHKNCCGYINGARVGVTKFAAFTVSGFCDLGSSILITTKRFLFPNNDNILDDGDYENWQREIEPRLGMHGEENDELIWFTESQQGLVEVYAHSVFKLEENKVIKNIEGVDIEGTVITIHYNEDQTDVTVFAENSQAASFANIVQSQVLREQIMVNYQ